MKILRFTLSGRQAFFKRPDVNTFFYFTYGHIHKVALLGMFGALLGYSGYAAMNERDMYPEFYERLQNIKAAIVPLADKGSFLKKVICFNNSVGYASKEQGGNLVVKQQWLENPAWNIYVRIEDEESKKIADALLNHKCVYMPYLGSNDHPADITNVRMLDGEKITDAKHIDSFCPKELIQVELDDFDQDNPYKYEEKLPFGLDKEMNQYILKKFILSNMEIISCSADVYKITDELREGIDKHMNIVFC